jgi:lipopolysaccharide biosynthesis protein
MVAIILHLYYQDLWNELKNKIQPLLNEEVHLYITINEETEFTDDMRLFAKEIFLIKNKGMDFGPFVYTWNKIKDKEYKYVLKIHGKKSESSSLRFGEHFGTIWRNQLINPIIKTKKKFDRIIEYMEQHPHICMAGSQIQFYDTYRESINDPNRINCLYSIQKLLQKINSQEHGCFFAGSMFFVTTDYLKKFFDGCDLQDLYEEFEDYYSSSGETLAHAMERVIGYGVEKHGGKFLTLEND